MRNKILFLPLALAAVFAISSCGNSEKTDSTTTATTDSIIKAPKELTDMTGVTSYYECPMKCEGKKFAEAGICPVCGMDLVLVELKSDSTATMADTTNKM